MNTDHFVTHQYWEISGGITGVFFEWDEASTNWCRISQPAHRDAPGIRPLYGWLVALPVVFQDKLRGESRKLGIADSCNLLQFLSRHGSHGP